MALCCIGGVCVPYTAIIPFMIFGIQWIVQKMMEYGLLPESVCKQLQGWISIKATTNKSKSTVVDEVDSCCCNENASKIIESSSTSVQRRGKQNKEHSAAVTTTNVTTTVLSSKSSVQIIETKDEWDQIVNLDESIIIICKFTASWCKPCKSIQPVFESLCNNSTKESNLYFVTIDVDTLDEITSQYNVVSLPTFVAIRKGRVIGKYSGSNEEQLRLFVGAQSSVSIVTN